MLEIVIPESIADYYNETTGEFVSFPKVVLQLEHSLASISKWEQKYHVSFISTKDKTPEQMMYYIKCMTLNGPVDESAYHRLTPNDMKLINDYMDDPATATTVSHTNQSTSKDIITAELVYYWMISAQIPFECQYWHINKLMMLIEVCGAKNTPPKKMSRGDLLARNAKLNAERRAKMKSKG